MGTRDSRDWAGLAVLALAYFLSIAATISVTRFDGGVAFVWVGTAILTARLATMRRAKWGAALLVCAAVSAIATASFGIGPLAAIPLAIVNVGEAAVGALLLRKLVGRRAVLDSHRWLIGFVIACGMVAPALGALFGAGAITLLLGRPFPSNALHWYSGHALGTLAFMPIAMLVMRGEIGRLLRTTRRKKLVELAALILLVGGVTAGTFAQHGMPLLFLPLLPVILATFRGGALASAASIVIVSVIGGASTLHGDGPIAMMDAGMGMRMQFLQFYIAATMLTILPVNAELERRAELFGALRESEARYRLVTESSTDIVLTVDPRGLLRFVSSSVRQFGGHDPAALIGQSVTMLVAPGEAQRALAGVRAAVATPHDVLVDEFRTPISSDDERWFESHSRAVLDDDGTVTGVVIALRDITQRKVREERLSRAALTDPLTSLANRRAFNVALAARVAAGADGCVAMFDLDHFKRVNDRHGHAAGDQVLRRFAAIARASVREQDIVARLGGEEFAVILPEASIEQARLVCDRLRIAVAAERFLVGNDVIAITISGGVAHYARGDAGDDVLHAADMALYRAKSAGRDQLALAA